MKTRTSQLTILTMLSATLLFTTNTERSLEASEKDKPTIEKHEKKQVQERAHPVFSWGIPVHLHPSYTRVQLKGWHDENTFERN
nr:hypothetical protein [Halobacillus amylolyticus]